jgi:glycosyltransferase involved in cell wall biosynthesis
MTINVALPVFGRGTWTGGFNYLKNTLRLAASHLTDELRPWVLLSPEENERFGSELAPLVDGRIMVDAAFAEAGRGLSLAKAMATGRDSELERLLTANGIDVAFENANFYGTRFSIPVVSWMPDFQHRYMPEMFGRLNWWRRELGFQMQVRAGRTIMVSSNAACDDLEGFYPSAKGRSHVVRFAIDLDQAPSLERGAHIRTTYHLPERFFFLPNQFWCHKNHGVIFEALGLLRAAGGLADIPPVVLTGHPKDPRNPTYFDDLMERARALKVAEHIRYLGLLPYDHVLSLNASCHAMINPSRFEGWSTSIEEAKAFATPLVLADIPIHREQAPGARFFDWRSPEEAAAALQEIAARPTEPRPPLAMLRSAQSERLEVHASALLATVKAAHAHRSVRVT